MSQKLRTESSSWNGALEAVNQALVALRRNPTPALFYVLALLVIEVLSIAIYGKPNKTNMLDNDIFQIVFTLLLLPFATRYQLALAKGKSVSITELLRSDFMLYVKLIAGLILTILVSIVGALLILIPLIWVLPWCTILLFTIVDKGYGPAAALKESRRLLTNHLSKAWGLLFITILFSIVAAFANSIPGFGTIVAGALSLVYDTAFAVLYLWLRKNAA